LSKLISICIPTLNRPHYLIEALESIFNYEQGKFLFEICISNNASNQSYAEVTALLEKKRNDWDIKYIVQDERLEIDPHMHFVVKMATSDYCYLLGDDDYFISDQLERLINLVKIQKPDLAIFNAIIVNGTNNIIGKHFKIESKTYDNTESAFLDLMDKGTFGSILVKRVHLDNSYFISLYGTSHAYGCYWLSILNDYFDNSKIIIPDFECVYLRAAEKNYTPIVVCYRDTPLYFAIFSRYLNFGRPQMLNAIHSKKSENILTSIRFIAGFIDQGARIHDIQSINPIISTKFSFIVKFYLARLIVSSGVYLALKKTKSFLKEFKSR
jgi:abequosyltransferase